MVSTKQPQHLSVGVLAVQGAVAEHIEIVEQTFKSIGASGTVTPIRRPKHLDDIERLIIPGGESTTISRLLRKFDLFEPIQERAHSGSIAIMGTCAGCILLAKEVTQTHRRTHSKPDLLGLMDMRVDRNAFGRQRESFEHDVAIEQPSAKTTDQPPPTKPFHAVFIRGPVITDVWGDCETIASINEHIVMAQQGRLLAVAFHPELTPDLRIHQRFLKL